MAKPILISTGKLRSYTLANQVAIVTGAGTGIGFEAARALVWLGAHVVIAEIDKKAGVNAVSEISKEMGIAKVTFNCTDVGNEASVEKLTHSVLKTFGRIDIVLNNAAVEPLGAVAYTPIKSWDRSYQVNLRGPVLLARAFLPEMIKRKSGVFVCVSSVGGAYMGPYEVLKRAQVELANTIEIECEGTGVIVFTIGPGLVPETRGAAEGIPKIAKMMGKTIDEFTEMSKAALISAEAAGGGFAAAIALASNFRGQETSSQEALLAAGIELEGTPTEYKRKGLSKEDIAMAIELSHCLLTTLEDQQKQWQTLGTFQRQWMFKDFNKRAGLPIDKYIFKMSLLEDELKNGKLDEANEIKLPLEQLAHFFLHMQELTKGFVKDPKIRDEQLALQTQWEQSAQKLSRFLI